jgi:O-antigen ligase
MDKYLKIISLILVLAIFSIPVIPQSGTMDVIGLQWFLLGIINLVGFMLLWNRKLLIFKPRPLMFLLLSFILLGGFSILYASNTTLALQDFSRWLSVFTLAYFLSILLKNNFINFKQISYFFSVFLLIEVLVILFPLIFELYLNGFQILKATSVDSNAFNGLTGNKNIAAASVMVKLPFVLYFFIESNFIKKILGTIIISLSVLSILFIAARASYISFLIFFLLSFIACFVFNKGIKQRILFLVPIFFGYTIGFVFGNLFIPTNASSSIVNKVNTISFTQEGSSGRTLLWKDAYNYTFDHPYLGGGLGSWKIESAPYWNAHGSDYLVPYHAHNDFLEIFAELGLFGGFLYLTIFLYLAFLFFIHIKFKFSRNKLIYFISLISLGCYFIDSFFNFPMERPIMQISFAFLLAIGLHLDKTIIK